MPPKKRPKETHDSKHSRYPFWETRECLRRSKQDPTVLLLKEAHLLYLKPEQAENYLRVLREGGEYSSRVHNPALDILRANVSRIFEEERGPISLVDLGPGYPDMSLCIAEHCTSRGIGIHYYPVDVSKEYLEIAATAMASHSVSSTQVLAKFETCQNGLPDDVYSRQVYVLIGLTFMNFNPEKFLPLLSDLARKNGKVIVSSGLITESNPIEKTLSNYQSEAPRDFTFGPLANLGIDPSIAEYEVRFSERKGRIECTFLMKGRAEIKDEDEEITDDLLQVINVGDRIVTAISHRYTQESLTKLLEQYFDQTHMYLSKEGDTVMALNSVRL